MMIFLFQNGVPSSICQSVDFQNTIINNMKQYPGESAATQNVTCCNRDGCNWNGTTAQVISVGSSKPIWNQSTLSSQAALQTLHLLDVSVLTLKNFNVFLLGLVV